MERVTSKPCCARPARATSWALRPTIRSALGARRRSLSTPLATLRRVFLARLGDDCQRATAPKGRGCMIGPISNWPTSRLETTTTRGLLIRRNIGDSELAFFSTWCPKGTSAKKLVAVEGCRWSIEDGFETAKNEFGLDHNETRSWHGWHRHVSLVMLAFAMMAAIRHRANAAV